MTPSFRSRSWFRLGSAASALGAGTLAELFPRVVDLSRQQSSSWVGDARGGYCRRCGATVDASAQTPRGCPHCLKLALPWDSVVRLGTYQPPLRDWIVAMKFAQQWSWTAWFGRQLAAALPAPPPEQPAAVCPVPMHWWRRWRRGYNQAQLIAQALAQQRHWPMLELLRRTRYTQPQTNLTASQRRTNIRRSFAARPVDLHGWDIWLVDDVKTTGATLHACARLLKRRGASHVHIAVVAVADPRNSDFRAI